MAGRGCTAFLMSLPLLRPSSYRFGKLRLSLTPGRIFAEPTIVTCSPDIVWLETYQTSRAFPKARYR